MRNWADGHYIPAHAREPMPPSGTTGIDPDATLGWRSGREAVSHEVYLGTDQQTVANGTAPAVSAGTNSYTPGTLPLGTTYYWKVNEVNTAEAISTWESSVWNFSVTDYLVVDDMESYTNDEGTRVFDTWADGWGSTDNGSQVGYTNAPFSERTIIHGGAQSMPFSYNNTSTIPSSRPHERSIRRGPFVVPRTSWPTPMKAVTVPVRTPTPRHTKHKFCFFRLTSSAARSIKSLLHYAPPNVWGARNIASS